MQFVFWQNILSPHQAPFLRALPTLGHDVTIVAAEALTADRLRLGWGVPDMGNARVIVSPTNDEAEKIVRDSDPSAIHVMSGARLTPLGGLAVQFCRQFNRRMGIISESPDPRDLAGLGRRFKYTYETVTRGRHYDFILAMGEMGVRWFLKCRYPARKVFTFAYVIDPAVDSLKHEPAGKFSFLYSGQFIHRKGLDILLRAFARLPENAAELRLLGEGPDQFELQALAKSLNMEDRVVWLPKRHASEVQLEMQKANVTVLPSRHDGWGAVVNESLTVGTPVICSAACGASELIRQPWLGTVYPTESVEALHAALAAWLARGQTLPDERERVRLWTSRVGGKAVAKYFCAIMDYVYTQAEVPTAPWRQAY